MKLSDKQERFCQEYMLDLNQTQAAIRAGYSMKTARAKGCNLFTKVYIQDRVEELKKVVENKSDLTMQKVLDELSRIAFLDIRKLYDEDGELKNVQDLDEDTARALAGIEVTIERVYGKDNKLPDYTKKFKTIDKKGALELLGKHFGGWIDKIEHSGELGVTFTDDV